MLHESNDVAEAVDKLFLLLDKHFYDFYPDNVTGSALLNVGVAIAVSHGATREEFVNQMGLVFDDTFKRNERYENEGS
jgi:hypothetical protein